MDIEEAINIWTVSGFKVVRSSQNNNECEVIYGRTSMYNFKISNDDFVFLAQQLKELGPLLGYNKLRHIRYYGSYDNVVSLCYFKIEGVVKNEFKFQNQLREFLTDCKHNYMILTKPGERLINLCSFI